MNRLRNGTGLLLSRDMSTLNVAWENVMRMGLVWRRIQQGL